MRRKILLLFLILSTTIINSQNSSLKKVDRIVRSYKNIQSIEQLAKKINNDFFTPIQKARAAYTWVASNINYKVSNSLEVKYSKVYYVTDEADLKRRLQKEDEKILNETFQTRRAVCRGYSLILRKLYDLINLESTIVLGYIRNSTYQIGFVPTQKNHAWNAVKINNRWMFVDATFGAGFSVNNAWNSKYSSDYFNIKKEVIRKTHFAENTYWREYLNQEALEEFCNSPLYATAFFSSKFQIVSPTIGEIKTKQEKYIQLQIKGLESTTKVHYQYGNKKNYRIASVAFNNSIANISIKSPKKNSDLRVYFDNELALEYVVSIY